MNIFHLDEDPETCARLHCDKHVVKMIVEYAQLLSSAHHVLDGSDFPLKELIYKKSHENHPQAIWVRSSSLNYAYLYRLFMCLGHEYTYRYGKIHSTIAKLRGPLHYLPLNIKIDRIHGPTMHEVIPQCMPDELKTEYSVDAYHNYYRHKKNLMQMRWTGREVPDWFT